MNGNILVIGATGKTGSRIVQQLKQKGLNPRIGSRNAFPKFDWHNKNTWIDTLKGIEKMYITYYPDLAVPGAKEIIESLIHLAKELGVKKTVLLSGKGETEAEACEKIVINSGLNYTIIRASWFNQNWSESFFLESILSGEVALPMSDVPIPFVDAEDIAEVASTILLNDKYNSKIIELTGPELITFKDIIKIISKVSNRKLNFYDISLEQYVEGMKQQNVPNDMVWLIEYLFSTVLTNPENQKITHGVDMVLGRPAKTFLAYAEACAKKDIWSNTEIQKQTL
ncbi:NmrA family transcriptional regulator [Seonamhaeicola algicola]|uniref:NmrA family transcriptional regulator n=1 Tax=Seonamhaeicola algicola TaxID=1719036 RepID=A0A5C7AYH7_9FLAO|nr:NmrA family NAD(P)-binding protein [Seonamhaeicola algicola]TXE13860.1 NmrA family transcriptional regulator [Seonamhaeicola algicola]